MFPTKTIGTSCRRYPDSDRWLLLNYFELISQTVNDSSQHTLKDEFTADDIYYICLSPHVQRVFTRGPLFLLLASLLLISLTVPKKNITLKDLGRMEATAQGLSVLDIRSDAEVVDENEKEPVSHKEGTLKEKLSSEGIPFETTTADLIRLLKDETIIKNRDIRYFLISESAIIALFATQAGPSLINHDFAVSHDPPISPAATSVLRRQWEINDYIFCKFLLFVLENRNFVFNVKEFNRPRYKASLGFLTENVIHNSSLVLASDYNLLYDYLRTIKDTMLLDWLVLTMRIGDGDKYLQQTVNDYHKNFEITNCYRNYYSYYTLVEQGAKQSKISALKFSNFFKLFDPRSLSFDQPDSKKLDDTDFGKNNETVFSFNINQDGTLDFMSPKIRHDILSKALGLQKIDSPLLFTQFRILSGLIDPLTQPLPNDKHIISIDFLYQLTLGFMFPGIEELTQVDGLDWKFHTCFNMQKIIKRSMIRLNFDDFERLNSINNSDESINWRKQLNKWLPHGFSTQNLELIYMVDILAVYYIYKSYEHLPIQLNPFLSTLISMWKNLTCVILLGLEIDRLEEEHETFDTPLLVRATVRGATALRSVVAAVLNGHVEYYKHDFKHESVNTFMSPYGRKLCQGALYADLRSHAAAILALGTDLEDVTELLADLQAGDRFDEDVRYMFEYEYDDFNDSDLEENDSRINDNSTKGKMPIQRRCNCLFDDDVMEHEGDYNESNESEFENGEELKQNQFGSHMKLLTTGKSQAVRHPNSFEFDYSGKDWRDIPRGRNFYYFESYKFIKNPDLEIIISLTLKASSSRLEEDESLLLLRSVASCVKNEQDELLLSDFFSEPKSHVDRNKDGEEDVKHFVQPDDIYDLWCLESTFEKVIQRNPHLAWRLMDEMLVCSGYRRVLIWFITHMKLKFPVIEYIYELVMGLRGSSISEYSHSTLQSGLDRTPSKKNIEKEMLLLPFSRQGSIELSNIETKMLMQEFFTNAAISLSEKSREANEGQNGEGETDISLYDVELMKLICSMVRTFIAEGKFDFSESESAFELQALLMNWLTIIPEARSLFFDLKTKLGEMNSNFEKVNGQGALNATALEDPATQETNDNIDEKNFEYNKKLMNLLPLPLKDNEANVENAAVQTLRNFINRFPFTSSKPSIGRKLIYENDEILPMAKTERPLDLHNYLLKFDAKYKSICISENEAPNQIVGS